LDRLVDAVHALQVICTFGPPAAAAESWLPFIEAFRLAQTRAAGWPAEIEHICRWYQPHLECRYEDAAVRHSDWFSLRR
jgi:hypothetical protein